MKRTLPWLALLLALIAGCLTYFRLWHKSEEVRGNLYALDKVLSGHTADVWAVSFSPDGATLATGSVDSIVKVWNIETGSLAFELRHPAGVTYLEFSPDGRSIATTSYDGVLRLWDVETRSLTRQFGAQKGTLWSVCFSPNGKTLATGGEDATVKVWERETGTLLKRLSGHTRNVWDVKYSPDGRMIASGSFDNTIKLWDVEEGILLRSLDGHSEAVVALAFSSDGKILASASDDASAKLWSTDDWSLLRTFVVPEHVQTVRLSADGSYLLTGGRDQTTLGEFLQNFLGDSEYNKGISMRLWDTSTGTLLQTFSGHANDVNDARISPSGTWIASGSSDRTVQLWRRVGS